MFVVDWPVARSRLPLSGALKVFSTQVLRLSNGGTLMIGNGVPKLQPVVLQSGSALFCWGATVKGLIVQSLLLHSSRKRLVEPSGVGPSGVNPVPMPMLRPPHRRLARSPSDASRVSPQKLPGAPLVKSSTLLGVARHWQSIGSQMPASGHATMAPPGDPNPESHCSPASSLPLPQGLVVDVVVDEVVVTVVEVTEGMVVEPPPRFLITIEPGSDTAPGPGRLAAPSTIPLPVFAMQNTDASVTLAGVPGVTGPAGDPVSVIARHAALPKQPA